MPSILDENQPFLDVAGTPIVNGSIYIGEVNLDPVTNPVTIYSDRELTTPIANPQLTDAYGRAENKIYTTSRYSIAVLDSNAVQQYIDLDAGGAVVAGDFFWGTPLADDGNLSSRFIQDSGNTDYDWYMSRGVQYVGGQWQLATVGTSPTGVFFNGDDTQNGIAILAAGNHNSLAAGADTGRPEDYNAVLELSGLTGIARISVNGATELSVSTDETLVSNRLRTAISGAASSGLRLGVGTAPSSPVDGDVWPTAAGAFNARLNGATVDLAAVGVAPSLQSAVATTSGTVVDQTGIPSTVTRITVVWEGVSWDGSSNGSIRIGDSGGIETTGYIGRYLRHADTTPTSGPLSNGFTFCDTQTAADITSGVARLELLDASTNTWACTINAYVIQNSVTFVCNGMKSLTGTLDRVRFTSTIPDNFDAGKVSFKWE